MERLKEWKGVELRHTAGLALVALFIAMAAALLSGGATPAFADDTDGGSGTSAGGSDGGCKLNGWALVDNPAQIVWDNYEGDQPTLACANPARAHKNSWTYADWTYAGTRHVCVSQNGDGYKTSDRSNCSSGFLQNSDAPLYRALSSVGAGKCYKENVHGIWYLQDGDRTPSWVGYGDTSYSYRTFGSLKNAIDGDSSDLHDANGNGTNAWWQARIKAYWGDNQYAWFKAAGLSDADLVAGMKAYLKSTVKDVIDGAPVIFCWFGEAPRSEGCKIQLDWGNWVHALSGDAVPANWEDCFLHCPSTARAHPGERLPASLDTQNKRNDYCWPPQSFSWSEGKYGSEIWSEAGYIKAGTVGGVGIYGWNTLITDKSSPEVDGQQPFTPVVNFKKSDFGVMYDNYCSNQTGCFPGRQAGNCNTFASDYNKATDPLNSKSYFDDDHSAVDLDAAHQEGLAQGRVIDVEELEMPTSLYCDLQLDKWYFRSCAGTFYYQWNGNIDVARSSNSCDISGDRLTDNGTSPSDPGSWKLTTDPAHPVREYNVQNINARVTQHFTQGFQVLTDHCNSKEFNEVANTSRSLDNSEFDGVVRSSDASHYFSASAVSKVFKGDDLMNGTASYPWGTGKAASPTSKASFFNRVCSFSGTLANRDNTAVTSLVNAQKGWWEFFRDGEWKSVDVAYFVPAASNSPVVKYAGEDPTATVIAQDPGGTPSNGQSNVRVTNLDGSASVQGFGGGDSAMPTLKQWSHNDYSADTIAVLNGAYNGLEARGIWGTTNFKPLVYSLRWRFEPYFVTETASRKLGFGRAGGGPTWVMGAPQARIAGMVTSVRATESPATEAMRVEQWKYSGEGSENRIDVPNYYGTSKNVDGEWTVRPDQFDKHYWAVAYRRATTE
jgi:hypothetical protein